MASRPETFPENESCAINKLFFQKKNTKKATNFGLSVFTGRSRIIFMLNLQQHRKIHLTKSPKCLRIVNKVPT